MKSRRSLECNPPQAVWNQHEVLYVINPKAGGYTLTRDAILRGRRLHTRPKGVITCQSFGLDKKLSNPFGLLNFLEVTVGFEPTDNGVADRGLTTWLRHHTIILFEHSLYVNKTTSSKLRMLQIGADYGARTRHLNLGKVALYQMS